MELLTKRITIKRDSEGQLTVDPDPLTCHVVPEEKKPNKRVDGYVEWKSEDYEHWRVVFGPHAPVNRPRKGKEKETRPEKVATPDKPKLEFRCKRPEDLRHVKYTVVVLDDVTGKLDHKDPELIIET
jgi:hypothetical protein